jgi:hypothetical protein
MDTNALKKFAQNARNLLIDQVTAKLDLVLDDAAPARREHPSAVKDLESAIARTDKQHVIEQVAYTWFIPAATQLFTPHWIVRYLVENSLGRLWLLNRPDSKLAAQMDYYIAPEEPETDFLHIARPEDIRICDPAAGSGHMLTYAFDLLYAIYEEEGYDATEIPALILTHNLTGVEIDDRAGALAAFALAMKAAAKLGRRRFLRMEAKPDICVLQNMSFTWGAISSADLSVRYFPDGFSFTNAGMCGFGVRGNLELSACFMNSKVVWSFLKILTPTLNFGPKQISLLPMRDEQSILSQTSGIFAKLFPTAKSDWDAYETSWDFTTLPLIQPDHRAETLEATYTTLRTHWQGMTDEMQRLEEENNRIFIDAYGLQDELTPEVPLNEITLTCNPAYRYGIKNDAAANEARLRADTMAEFLSYAVGCMFGRYSLDAPGLILANQGETLADYLARIPEPQFMPDEDNVIPVLDANWFPDDITERYRTFLRVTFGDDKFRENLSFIEDALGKDIRKYFTKDFYADHVKRYKKRPIYWMFSSPKGTFNALIYMHRYRGDTVSVLLNDYLREFITKLEGERGQLDKLSDDATATQAQRTKALKDAGAVAKQIDELNAWERDVIFPLAQQKIEIDLDDGVKANYPKFGTALKKIAGLEAKDD